MFEIATLVADKVEATTEPDPEPDTGLVGMIKRQLGSIGRHSVQYWSKSPYGCAGNYYQFHLKTGGVITVRSFPGEWSRIGSSDQFSSLALMYHRGETDPASVPGADEHCQDALYVRISGEGDEAAACIARDYLDPEVGFERLNVWAAYDVAHLVVRVMCELTASDDVQPDLGHTLLDIYRK